MNFFVTAVLLAVSIGQLMARPGHTAEEMKMIEQLVMTCMAKEGANEGDLAKMMEFELPTTKAGQCLNACMMEMSGIISGGVISIENSMEATRRRTGNNAAKVKASEEVLHDCVSKAISADRCEYAMQFMECSHAGAAARGYTQMEMLSE